MADIKGIEKFASRDFPGHISATVFLGGCTFRCPYCHNADLVLRPEAIQTTPVDIFLSFLDARKDWLEGVCLSGGEPLLNDDVEDLVRIIRDRGLLVKLDTNGSFPGRLEHLLGEGLLDWVAMDIKAPLERYREVARVNVEIEDIVRSADLVRNSGLRTTFRTTVVPGLVGRDDIIRIGEWLKGAESYVLQQFVPHNTIDPAFLEKTPYDRRGLEAMAEAAGPYFREVRIEGP